MSYHLNGVMLDTMAHEFAIRFPNLPDSVKLDFDGTLLCQLAEDGNHVVKGALNLGCGFVDEATTIAQTHGGGGGSPGSGWGKRLCQLAEDGNHVVKGALNLGCGFVDEATTIAQTHGGGGGSPGSGWGKRPDEDDREWARRCLAMARKMCAPSVRRRKKM